MDPIELEMNRYITSVFIDSDPAPVILKTRVKEQRPDGSYRYTNGADRPPQVFKMVYGGSTGAGRAGMVDTGDGRERMFSYILIGGHDSLIEPGDFWTDSKGQHWEVEELLPFNGYEVKATVRSYGQDPQYG